MDAVVSVIDFMAHLKREGLVIISEAHLQEAEKARQQRALRKMLSEQRYLTYAEIVRSGVWNVETVKGARAILMREFKEGEDYIVSKIGQKPITKILRPSVERIMGLRGQSWNI